MADPEQIYQEVLQAEQAKGSAPPVAEGRAKAARSRAEHGSPHPTEPKWWPGAQPHLESGDGAAPVAEPAAADAAPEPEPVEQPAAEAATPAAPAPVAQPDEAPVEQTPAAVTTAAPATAAPTEVVHPAAGTAPAAATADPATAAPATAAPAPTVGVSPGTPTGNRLRPEDGVSTEAQFDGQRAMYERRKLIDELVASGVPAVTASDTGRPRASGLAILYLLIPLLVIGYLLTNQESGTAEGGGGEVAGQPQGGGGGTTLVAEGTAWSPPNPTIELTAGEPTDYTLENRDSVEHNMAIYPSEEEASDPGNALFTSPDAEGGATEEFTIDPLDKGDYYFICDYHPTMTGTVVAE